MYSVCGLTRYAHEVDAPAQTDNSGRYSVAVGNLEGNAVYVFNVIAMGNSGTSNVAFVSQSILVPSGSVFSSGRDSLLRTVLLISIPVGVIIACVIFVLCRRNRIMSKELGIEMGDSFPVEELKRRGGKKYEHVVDEHDFSDDDVGFSPKGFSP
eukprot:TRINITY_DN2089_c0_g1_i10.p1 TRINITY_DN2089_c0_g1~~TRINITY_DN2089_c0_g1_i10.p1  ORF type:complete len:154 (-),score=35.63 TRINITY_DN2089_c0_g1_i10:51-512(-)